MRLALALSGASLLGIAAVVALAGWRISRRISHSIRGIATELSSEAKSLSEAAGQMTTASQAVANGASRQAEALQQTSASLQEMTTMTSANSQHAQEATDLAARAHQSAESGARLMAELHTTLQELNASSGDTGRIVRTIDEIAFQTNILDRVTQDNAAGAEESAAVAEELNSQSRQLTASVERLLHLVTAAAKVPSEALSPGAGPAPHRFPPDTRGPAALHPGRERRPVVPRHAGSVGVGHGLGAG